jgi:N-acylneuraminate-9-phosphatase
MRNSTTQKGIASLHFFLLQQKRQSDNNNNIIIMSTKLKAVFFDLDDTLVPTSVYDVRAYADVKASVIAWVRGGGGGGGGGGEIQLDVDKLVADFKEKFVKAPWDPEYKTDVFTWRSRVWEHALKLQNVENAEEVGLKCQKCFDDNRMGTFPLYDCVKELTEYINSKGLETCIITNGHHRVQRDKLEACNAYTLFENIIVGGEEVLAGRKEKPDSGIFMKACKYVGCLPSEAIHVGDSLGADIQGGINAGLLATVFINVKSRDASTIQPIPTYTIKHIAELKEVIDKLLL